MATAMCEITWIMSLLRDLQDHPQVALHFCDNQVHVAKNPILLLHERTKGSWTITYLERNCKLVSCVLYMFLPTIRHLIDSDLLRPLVSSLFNWPDQSQCTPLPMAKKTKTCILISLINFLLYFISFFYWCISGNSIGIFWAPHPFFCHYKYT